MTTKSTMPDAKFWETDFFSTGEAVEETAKTKRRRKATSKKLLWLGVTEADQITIFVTPGDCYRPARP
jgi:hypothetical protein